MGMVESWELHQAPAEVQAAFVEPLQLLWAEAKRRGRPRLEARGNARLPRRLLSSVAWQSEVDGGIEIPCVTEVVGRPSRSTEKWQTRGRGKRRKRSSDVKPTLTRRLYRPTKSSGFTTARRLLRSQDPRS